MSKEGFERPKILIGIGASAGGLEPLQDLLTHLSSKISDAAIIVAQHLSPNYKSMLVELLARKTKIPVLEAKSGLRIKPNHIYTIPPDNDLIIQNDFIQLKRFPESSPKPSVNILLESIAAEYGKDSVGIILSGTGHDGSRGIEAIKLKGGVTIAQLPASAKYDGMPNSAINTGKVDYIMSPKNIGNKFLQLIRKEKVTLSEYNSNQKKKEPVAELLEMMEDRVGTDFSNYKTSTIYRRLEKRMSDKKMNNIEDYLKYINDNHEELDNLFQYMLIGVTSFFRNPEVFTSLKKVIEEIVLNKYKDDSLRVWIPGCATGEEAYTVGIIISEILHNNRLPNINVQIFATDIDQNALGNARNGLYESSKIENIPKDILDNYFIKRGDKYELISKIKKMILFSRHDVLSNPPFLRLDLITCRNMLIYFDQSLQKQLLPIFHYALNSDGFLLLGKSESVGNLKNLFSSVDSKNKIYQRKDTDSKMIKFPHTKPMLPKKITAVNAYKKENISVGEMVKETLYSSIEYPYVVIDDNLDMIELQGDISKYLAFKPGVANMNILKQINNDLQIELRAVITKAIKSGDTIKGNIKQIQDNKGNSLFLRFVVKPLMYSKPNNPFYLVLFEDQIIDGSLLQFSSITTKDKSDPHLLQLEQELEATKEHMNTLIEELEASNEELQALNEELQSSNEELQASNEELETSNEELQATNEELETAYAEINAAAEEIEKQNLKIKESENNLKTIFNSTLQAFILVDKNYNVLTFNQTAENIYKSLYGKIIKSGTSYVDLIPNDHFISFKDSFKKALEGTTVAYEEQVVNTHHQNRYLIYNYYPVEKDETNKNNDFVCISFIDDTARVSAEKELKVAHLETQKQKNLWEELSLTSPDLIAILRTENFKYEFVNPTYKKLFPEKRLIGNSIFDIMPHLKDEGFIEVLQKVRNTGKIYRANEIEANIEVAKGKMEKRYFNITYAPLKTEEALNDIIIYATDITEQVISRKELESAHQEIAVQKNRLEELIVNAPASIAVTKGPDHIIEYINPQFQTILKSKDLINKKLSQILPEQQSSKFLHLVNDVYYSGNAFISKEVSADIFERPGENGEVENKFYNFILQPWKDTDDNTQGIIIYTYDVSDQVLARKQIENIMQHFRVLTDAMPQNVWTANPNGKFEYLNKNFTKYLGIGNNRRNIDWMKFVHPEDLEETNTIWHQALKKNTDFQIQHRIKSNENDYKWHLTRGVPYFDEEDKGIIKWIGTTTDIHDQKSTEALKEEFISVASHELKTPLTTLKAYFDLLYHHVMEVGDHNTIEYVEKSVTHVNKLNSLIADLLDISRIEGGKIKFAQEEIDFDEFVKENVQNLQHTSKSHILKLEGETKSIIIGDRQRLEQVFTNLVSNAIKYSPDSDEVCIKINIQKGRIITTVKDHGIGIPPEKLNRIFDRFYRVSDEENFISGLGIGLYITKEIISRHNGDIWAKSSENDGTEFKFSLPVSHN